MKTISDKLLHLQAKSMRIFGEWHLGLPRISAQATIGRQSEEMKFFDPSVDQIVRHSASDNGKGKEVNWIGRDKIRALEKYLIS